MYDCVIPRFPRKILHSEAKPRSDLNHLGADCGCGKPMNHARTRVPRKLSAKEIGKVIELRIPLILSDVFKFGRSNKLTRAALDIVPIVNVVSHG